MVSQNCFNLCLSFFKIRLAFRKLLVMVAAQGSVLRGSLRIAVTTSAQRIDLLVPQMAVRMFERSFFMDLAPGKVHCVPCSIFGIAQAATALALSA